MERLHAAERAYKDGEITKARERLLEIAAEIDGVSDMEDRREKEMGKEQEKLKPSVTHASTSLNSKKQCSGTKAGGERLSPGRTGPSKGNGTSA